MESNSMNNNYDLYQKFDGTFVDKTKATGMLKSYLCDVMTEFPNEEAKEECIDESNISYLRINLLVRPVPPKFSKKPTKVMRRPIGIQQLKQDFSKLTKDIVIKMNKLWVQYIDKIMEISHNLNSLLNAEIQGGEISIIQSKNPLLVGKRGICVYESKNVIVLASPTTPVKITTIPKEIVNMKLHYKDKCIILYGRNWTIRPCDRIETKNFKEIKPIHFE
ncbi:hypothetical protein, conserved [Entamoeba dispar SAW760]|uniref:Uncharacterized protein n=1 Tax=Entamoeba dispar (strain ATCC PRA-260 / SAW760) TaxID=370354 RepID=B0EQ42_ENTDS|nr:uncharacterized protein EDI_150790 [Entamoeba dispar SAW760]EDR23330.1 hypothetical protein, conserved [Entamoeba dispar SAW760]|eukprot:EDR23330.1 hypothetical protein, conserved [Entamoeba dispar SAW760]